ncbi:MAG: hypothetical protein HY658_04600, partial [Actinobacteria bacterium]|nr:hypothetical protein [Actinomycetota bacterium]
RWIRAQLRGLSRADQWNVGVAERPIASFLERPATDDVRWLPEPRRGTYVADPFAVPGEALTVLVEHYDQRAARGRIDAIEAGPDGRAGRPRPALALPVHASYPYVFEHDKEVYCVPETAEAREVVLHRAVDPPSRWEPVATLVSGLAALDPTVFRHEGRWWLMCTDADRGVNEKLHVFHAQDLEGPWEAHAANPVKTDVRSSRPAGTPFVNEGRLYRPAQDASRTYGGAVAVNLVERLSPTEFRERVVAVVEPDPGGPFPDGLHTLSAAGDRTLVDGKRTVFAWGEFRRELKARSRRIGARPRRR